MILARRAARLRRAALGLPLLFCCGFALGQQAPEAPSGFSPRPVAVGQRFMVAAAHLLAVDAGYRVLRGGGSAMDAAVAVQFVLGLVEPQSSGVGGGAFVLHYSASEGRVRAYDGRETAPAAASQDRLTALADRRADFPDTVLSGKSVGVPGAVAVLELAHRRHGRLPWAALLDPAIELAERGFPISPRLRALLERAPWLRRDPFAAQYFFDPAGRPKPAGTVLRNPDYAGVLRAIAEGGASALHRGEIAQAIVAAVADHPVERGDLTLADLERYAAKEREPVCGPVRSYRVCGMPPPSSGGIAVLQILGILERLPRTDYAADPLRAVHYFAEAGRLAYADRDRYVADPDFVAVPVAGLLAPDYLTARAALVAHDASLGRASPGVPAGIDPHAGREAATLEPAATTHFSIVDADGDAVAVSSSIESAFGNHRFVRGFLLNNQLSDFAFRAEEGGVPVANRVAGGKRPRSSMSPTFVFDGGGRLMLVAGSPGGYAIINYVARVVHAVLDWQMDLGAALAMPNFGSSNGPTELEARTDVERLAPLLARLGHTVRITDLTSGVHAIQRVGGHWIGAADPRRDGAARGE